MECFSPSNDRDEKIDAILNAARRALEFWGDASDAIPVPGLSVAVSMLGSIIDAIQVCPHALFRKCLKGLNFS